MTTDELLTVEQVAERLKLGRTKMYELMDARELPSVKFGRARRIPASSLAALVARKLKEAEDA